MKKMNIGDTVAFKYDNFAYKGTVEDVYELGLNDFVYEVSTSYGTFHLNNNGEPIV